METTRKKPSALTGLILCVLGIVGIRFSQPIATNWDLAIVLLSCMVLLISMMINFRYLFSNFFKAIRRK
ncbi:hypothetical protein AM493_07780 [Flavobacterium akiainvivens]|uniref:Uncharacterized protein n=1 Tax=Flavobacterium akiainvivens TaxID=1202724 RepID=A0A0M9VHU5_9FLAO|nr:hypothetical protein [Flavobacterium akiainvivens]KOS05946.1 hypothetical protein AM493_07780 [Flavobacterium akiainvivens]SFQ53525.1 hypothetical protein SAMN05444144_10736 [Flavobacterium akiainvivens]